MLASRPSWQIVYAMWLAVAGAATDSRQTPSAAWHAARTRELATRTASDTRHTALPARTAAGPGELSAGSAVAIGVAAAAAWVLLEDRMRRCARHRASPIRFSCRHRSNSNRCSNSPAHYQ
jgi:hypothetical protein